MLAGLIGYYWYAYNDGGKTGESIDLVDSCSQTVRFWPFRRIIGGAMIRRARFYLLRPRIKHQYNIPEDVIGLSVVVLGTSYPSLQLLWWRA